MDERAADGDRYGDDKEREFVGIDRELMERIRAYADAGDWPLIDVVETLLNDGFERVIHAESAHSYARWRASIGVPGYRRLGHQVAPGDDPDDDRCHVCGTSSTRRSSTTEGVPACAQHAGQLPDHAGPFFIDGDAYDDAETFADDLVAALGAKMRQKNGVAHRRPACFHFGSCPDCIAASTVPEHEENETPWPYLNVGKAHWFYCDTHRTRWFAGVNLMSSWTYETEDEQRTKYDGKDFGSYRVTDAPKEYFEMLASAKVEAPGRVFSGA